MALILKRVGRYELLKEIGRGGMATVYLARQTDLDRHVALKELASLHSADEAFAERFLRESRMAGSLSHPNIVTVHDYFEHEGTPYISMEYIERGSLRPLVGHLTLAQIVGVLEGLLAGLQHAAGRGIVHRDMKPENVMVTGEGGVKISDFGIGRALNQAGQASRFLTATGTAIGTPAYMAPEQAMAKEVGPWTDLYSLGIMAYEMVLGEVPFSDSETPMSMLVRHVSETIPAPSTIDPSIDPQLGEWLEWLLKKDPTDRPPSAGDAWDKLEEIIIHLLGPRWRREARLGVAEPHTGDEEAKPLTPAPFSEERAKVSLETPQPQYVTVDPLAVEAAVAEDVAAPPASLAPVAGAPPAVETPSAAETPPAVETPAAAEELTAPPAAAPAEPAVEAPPAAEVPEGPPAAAIDETASPADAEMPASPLDLGDDEEDMYLTFAPGAKKAVAPPPEPQSPAPVAPVEPEVAPAPAAEQPAPVAVPPAAAEPAASPAPAVAPPGAPEPPAPEPPAPVAAPPAEEPMPVAASAAEPLEEHSGAGATGAVAGGAVAAAAAAAVSKPKRGLGRLKKPNLPKLPELPGIPNLPPEVQQFAPGVAGEIAEANAEVAAVPQDLRVPSAGQELGQAMPGVAEHVAEAQAVVGDTPGAPTIKPKLPHAQAQTAGEEAPAAVAAAVAPEATPVEPDTPPPPVAAPPVAAPPVAQAPAPEPPAPEDHEQKKRRGFKGAAAAAGAGAVAAAAGGAAPSASAAAPELAAPEAAAPAPPAPPAAAEPPAGMPPSSTPLAPDLRVTLPPEKAPKAVEHPSFVLTDAVKALDQEKETKLKIKPIWIIGAVVLVAAAVVGFIVVAGGGSSKKAQTTPTTAPTTTTPPATTTPPVIAEVRPTPGEQQSIAGAGTSVIVASPGGVIERLSGATLKPQATTTDPAQPSSISQSYGRVFVADNGTIATYKVNDLALLDAVGFPGAEALAGGGASLPLFALSRRAVDAGQLCTVTPQAVSPCTTLPFAPSGGGVRRISAANSVVYVVDRIASTVVPYTATKTALTAGAPIKLSAEPQGDPVAAGSRLYVPVRRGIDVVNVATGKVTSTIALPVSPLSLVAVGTKQLFAALFTTNQVAAVNLSNPAGTPTLIKVENGPVALTTAAGSVYVVNGVADSAQRIDPGTLAVTSVSNLPSLGSRTPPIEAQAPRIVARGRTVTVTLPLAGGTLPPSGLVVSSKAISTGHAAAVLWQGGIKTAGGTKTAHGVTVRTSGAPGRVDVVLQAQAGDFTKLAAGRSSNGRTVFFTLTQKPAPPPVGTTTPVTTPPPTSTSTPPPTSTSAPPTSTSTPPPTSTSTPPPTSTSTPPPTHTTTQTFTVG